MNPSCLSRSDADANVDPGGAQYSMATSRHPRIRVLDRCENAPYPGRDDRLGTRRRPSKMGAWLQRNIEGCAPRSATGLRNHSCLGVRPSPWLSNALRDDARRESALINQNGANGRVRPGSTEI